MNDATQTVPVHIGLILDGNRRWARVKGVNTLEGHRVGYDNLKDIAKAAFDKGVGYVSAYIFSTENWDRTKREVNYLMGLAYKILTRDVDELNKQNVKVLWLGSAERLSGKLKKAIEYAEETTKNNTKGTLCLCFNYGGKQELADAFNKLAKDNVKNHQITPEHIDQSLYHPEVPAIDLVIRTSGEQRFSGFMLWRLAYAEFYFLDKYWPDFSVADLSKAIKEYAKRERRLGN